MEINGAVTVRDNDLSDDLAYRHQVLERRRKTLSGFLLLASIGMLLIYIQILAVGFATNAPVENLARLQIAAPLIIIGAALCYVVARRGAVTASAYGFLSVCLLIATFLDDPAQVVSGR